MLYFRYTLLNGLRDELWLTQTRQKATLFAFFYLAFPVWGCMIGYFCIPAGQNWAWKVIGIAVGFVIGAIAARQLPRLLWAMLWFFQRKGWFLQPASLPNSNLPVLTGSEYLAWCKSYKSKSFRQNVWVWPCWFVLMLTLAEFCTYMDRTTFFTPALNFLAGAVVLLIIVPGVMVWPLYMQRRLFQKHGLLCPFCKQAIPAMNLLAKASSSAFCRQCGTKIVEFGAQKPVSPPDV